MNISRPDFTKSIDTNSEQQNTVLNLNIIFDEIMALYNIISDDYVSVQKISDSECIAKFRVQFVSTEKAHNIYECVSYRETVVYGKLIQIICWETEDSDTLIMSFRQVI